MEIKYASICDIGLKAKENQDRILCLSDGHSGLFAVADGMGGLYDGSFASQTIIEELTEFWHRYTEVTCPVDGERNGTEGLKTALRKANAKILSGTPEGRRCGSTIVVLLIENGCYTILSCGDSRCYREEKKLLFSRFCCLTRDDVWENTESFIRGMSREEIRRHRNFGKLVRAVGTGVEFTCSETKGELAGETAFLLCSDGMHKRVAAAEVEQVMKQAFSGREESLKTGCETLKTKVYQKGAGDNVSVILVRYGK